MINKKAILFDLDGTLLSMDQDKFVKAYFSLLAKKLATHGYDPEKLIKVMWAGVEAMTLNDGSKSNEDAFFEVFSKYFGQEALKDKAIFEEFYQNEFNLASETCGVNPEADALIKKLKNNYRVILATNPLFPRIATLNRIKWAKLDKDDFELITTYEDFSSTKPNTKYYEDILQRLNLKPEECLMVGNDINEDIIPTTKLNMDNFLITKDIINKNNVDITNINKGNFSDLERYIFN